MPSLASLLSVSLDNSKQMEEAQLIRWIRNTIAVVAALKHPLICIRPSDDPKQLQITVFTERRHQVSDLNIQCIAVHPRAVFVKALEIITAHRLLATTDNSGREAQYGAYERRFGDNDVAVTLRLGKDPTRFRLDIELEYKQCEIKE